MAVIDSTKSAAENLIALVVAANPALTITPDQVIFQAQAAQAPDGDGHNTNISIQAVVGEGYKNAKTITYTRLGLNTSVAAPNFTTPVDDGVTAEQIIAAIALANNLIVAELNPALTGAITRPVGGALTSTVTLTSNAGSLVYVDASTQEITLDWADHSIDLATAVAVTSMTGFDVAS